MKNNHNKESFNELVERIKPIFQQKERERMQNKKSYRFLIDKDNVILHERLKQLKMHLKEKSAKRIVEMAIENTYNEMQEKGNDYVAMQYLIERIRLFVENTSFETIKKHEKERKEILSCLDELESFVDKIYDEGMLEKGDGNE